MEHEVGRAARAWQPRGNPGNRVFEAAVESDGPVFVTSTVALRGAQKSHRDWQPRASADVATASPDAAGGQSE